MEQSRINKVLRLDDGREVLVREPGEPDLARLLHLYDVVYGGSYTLPEISDPDKMKWVVHDSNYVWLIAETQGRVVGSVMFVKDDFLRIAKTMAGVVLPELRGSKVLTKMLRLGMDWLMYEQNLCDLVYAVVRTFISLSFHRDLKNLGFVDLGVFPNVRKIRQYETHSLKVAYRDRDILEERRKGPLLIPEALPLYDICRGKLGLEEAEVQEVELPAPPPGEKLEFLVEDSPEVEQEYYRKRKAGELRYDFFPFHYPQLRLYTKDFRNIAYLHFLRRDGHGSLLGFKTDREDLVGFLISLADNVEALGFKYLELVLPAYEPIIERIALEANFLPCAYFPAFERTPEGERLDYLITSCTFSSPHFKGLKLTEDTKPYLQAYYKIYTQLLWEDLQRA
jgi:hypothetical protein